MKGMTVGDYYHLDRMWPQAKISKVSGSQDAKSKAASSLKKRCMEPGESPSRFDIV